MNNKIQEIKKAVQSLEANYPMEMWDWEEKQMKYLLSEYERITTTLEYIAEVCLDKRCLQAAQEALAHKG
ncbi:hypothetical protein J2Z32_004481 [Paenibacillus turicensis]|uniref:Uncharacterized protein n=1 Tax=Paenibacillus turicensis TaxID=160487 RepID=A0ABS4FZ07_9BACL|nr:hypothetical protein [Paenibacillus turicensis]MBP1907792.1 hypothetical protein [Paenibacillus turicensis]